MRREMARRVKMNLSTILGVGKKYQGTGREVVGER